MASVLVWPLRRVSSRASRTLEGGTWQPGRRCPARYMACIASGVRTKRRSLSAARERRADSNELTYNSRSTGHVGGDRHRVQRTAVDLGTTMCSMAGATPSPAAAADQAALSLANTLTCSSGTRSWRSSRPTSESAVGAGRVDQPPLPGQAPPCRRNRRATDQRHPVAHHRRRVSTPASCGPMATSASRSCTSASISSVVATPRLTSMPPARAVNACSRAGHDRVRQACWW